MVIGRGRLPNLPPFFFFDGREAGTVMFLLLMRHADAADGGGDDRSRVLSEYGGKQALAMGDWLRRIGVQPGTVISSPYPRAVETADLVVSRLENAGLVKTDDRLAPGMTVDEGSALIHECGDNARCVLLTGHAPDMGDLIGHLIGADGAAIVMRKGAVAMLETERAGFGGSMLHWLINPNIRADS